MTSTTEAGLGRNNGHRVTGKGRRRHLKLAYKNAQREAAWIALGIDRAQLDALYEYVESNRVQHGCDHTLRYTEEWAVAHPDSE